MWLKAHRETPICAGAIGHREASGKQGGLSREGAVMENKRESEFAGWWHLWLCRKEILTGMGWGCLLSTLRLSPRTHPRTAAPGTLIGSKTKLISLQSGNRDGRQHWCSRAGAQSAARLCLQGLAQIVGTFIYFCII